MARNFNGTTQALTVVNNLGFTAYPFSWACWFRSTSLNTATIMGFATAAGANVMRLRILSAGQLRQEPPTTGQAAITTTVYTANTWYHALGVCGSNTDRRVFLNGGGKGTNTANVALQTVNEFSIGNTRGADPFGGLIAEATVWNIVLSDAEAAALATGISPRSLRPQNIVAYWPLYGQFSPEVPYKGSVSLPLVNAPTSGAHVRIFGVT